MNIYRLQFKKPSTERKHCFIRSYSLAISSNCNTSGTMYPDPKSAGDPNPKKNYTRPPAVYGEVTSGSE